MEHENGSYVSVFKIDGKPILPPVVCKSWVLFVPHFATVAGYWGFRLNSYSSAQWVATNSVFNAISPMRTPAHILWFVAWGRQFFLLLVTHSTKYSFQPIYITQAFE